MEDEEAGNAISGCMAGCMSTVVALILLYITLSHGVLAALACLLVMWIVIGWGLGRGNK